MSGGTWGGGGMAGESMSDPSNPSRAPCVVVSGLVSVEAGLYPRGEVSVARSWWVGFVGAWSLGTAVSS